MAFAKRRLTEFFSPKQNVCAERYRFRSRAQQAGESTAQWVSVLRQLAASCDYGSRTEEFIRDQVVERTSSNKLRQRLLMEGSGLTLQTTLTIADTQESAEREAQAMGAPAASGAAYSVPVQAVHHHQKKPKPKKTGRFSQGAEAAKEKCFGCGREGHRASHPSCPAKGVQCHQCGRYNLMQHNRRLLRSDRRYGFRWRFDTCNNILLKCICEQYLNL